MPRRSSTRIATDATRRVVHRSPSTSSATARPRARSDMKAVLGGKGANLAEMTNLGVPVPPGFTIACALCIDVSARRHDPRRASRRGRDAALARLEEATGKRFGDPTNPLLVSVRSGAPVSMPGMMETILNLGLNDRTVVGLARRERQRALRLRLVSPLHPDVRRRRARRADPRSSSICSRPKRMTAGVDDRRRARRGRAAKSRRGVQVARPRTHRQRLPDGPGDAALGRDRSGLEVVDAQEGRRLPPRERHLRDARHRRERRVDGVRQPRRRLGNRRRIHAQSVDRRDESSTASS